MCTAATYRTKGAYVGRNLDYEMSYGESVAIMPRNYELNFREAGTVKTHYAMIGIAHVADEYPLYYDAANEKGLGMCGLNFVGNATYYDHVDGKDNVAQFEFIPWILSQCANVDEAKVLLDKMNFRNIDFSAQLPCAQLHWIISDGNQHIVVEAMPDGMHVYDNPVGILTNNPPFDKQLLQLSNYQHLTATAPDNKLAPDYNFPVYSRGMGAIGLPGDLSSESRFAKAAFTKLKSISADDEISSVSQFFHILHSVDQQNGCCDLGDNKYEHTLYSSCYSLTENMFYYTCYDNHQITAFDLKKANLDDEKLNYFPMIETEQVNYLN